MTTNTDWDLMTEEQVRTFLNCSRADLHQLIEQGVLNTLKLGDRVCYFGEAVANVAAEFRVAFRRAADEAA